MSRALDYGGLPLSRKLIHHLKLSAMTGSDDQRYLFRVREMKKYIGSALGVSPVAVTKDFTTAFAGRQGIVAFDVSGWSDASGHVALWDGSHFREEHDSYATRIVASHLAGKQMQTHVTSMHLWPVS